MSKVPFIKNKNTNYHSPERGVFLPDLEKREETKRLEVSDGDVALFIQKRGTASVAEIRRVKVDEDGRGELVDIPTILSASILSIESLTDPDSHLFSHSFSRVETEEQEETKEEKAPDSLLERLLLNSNKKKASPIPSIEFHLDTKKKGEEHLLELNYKLDAGLLYDVEYNGTIDPTGSVLNLQGHYNFANRTGKTYKNASLFLLKERKKPKSPSVPQEQQQQQQQKPSINSRISNSINRRSSYENISEESSNIKTVVSSPLPNKVTLNNGKVTHVKFVNAKVPMTVFNLIQSIPSHALENVIPHSEREFPGMNSSFLAEKVISFNNNAEAGLGVFLPPGVFNVSRKEANGFGAVFGTQVDFKAVQAGSSAFIKMGNMDKVVASRKVTRYDYDKVNGKLTETVEVTLSNSTKEEVKVTVMEAAYRGDDFELVGNGWERSQEDRKIQIVLTLSPVSRNIATSYTIKYNVPVVDAAPVSSSVLSVPGSSLSKSNSNSKSSSKKLGFW